jgi:uncharacterized protein
MSKKSILILSIVTGIILFLFSCKKEKQDDDATPEFDRKAMLSNIGSNIIIPNYQILQTEANALDAAVTQFTTTTDSANLIALQIAFKNTYNAWQLCSTFELGPAETDLLRANVNTFPTDTAQINSNISSGSYNLGTASNLDAKGFPAIDYLLFNTTVNNLLLKYTSDANAGNRKVYLSALSGEIKTKVTAVYNSWITSGGNYITTFSNNTGADVGSSLGLLTNQLNYDFETLKNYKIGIPLGKKTLGTPLPEKVEGYYGKNSVALAVEQLKNIERIYLGKSGQGIDGTGIDEYLIHLKSQYNGGLLSTAIKSQLTTTINKLQSIPDPLSQTILNNPSVVDAVYLEMQKLVVLFKTDMPSALGVLITYQDNDGD